MLLNLGNCMGQTLVQAFPWCSAPAQVHFQEGKLQFTDSYWHPKPNQQGKAFIYQSTLALSSLHRGEAARNFAKQGEETQIEHETYFTCATSVHVTSLAPIIPVSRSCLLLPWKYIVPCASWLTLQMCSAAAIMAKRLQAVRQNEDISLSVHYALQS